VRPTPTDSAGQARSRVSTCIVKALRSEGLGDDARPLAGHTKRRGPDSRGPHVPSLVIFPSGLDLGSSIGEAE
jgi:hypothetical protein